MALYTVEKKLDGYSICFRQWKAKKSHCQFLHGYSISFKLYFCSKTLDECGWVWDFGWLKNPNFTIDDMQIRDWFDYMFDHTLIISKRDPEMSTFLELEKKNIVQLRVLDDFSCEHVAKYVHDKVGNLIKDKTKNSAQLYKVDVIENDRNAASYSNHIE